MRTIPPWMIENIRRRDRKEERPELRIPLSDEERPKAPTAERDDEHAFVIKF